MGLLVNSCRTMKFICIFVLVFLFSSDLDFYADGTQINNVNDRPIIGKFHCNSIFLMIIRKFFAFECFVILETREKDC